MSSFFAVATLKQVIDDRVNFLHYMGIKREEERSLVTITRFVAFLSQHVRCSSVVFGCSRSTVGDALKKMKLHHVTALVVVDLLNQKRYLGYLQAALALHLQNFVFINCIPLVLSCLVL
jgi:hypothetical protein